MCDKCVVFILYYYYYYFFPLPPLLPLLLPRPPLLPGIPWLTLARKDSAGRSGGWVPVGVGSSTGALHLSRRFWRSGSACFDVTGGGDGDEWAFSGSCVGWCVDLKYFFLGRNYCNKQLN